ncbi:hypothetical protein L1987_10256 [Smallanthus sonchifolius]|uniref:Uncharacterized protein n=1 Tax=Smallanthus sonchifolius TaxID=185202 RepID=A0ACB9JRL1_9ASTR|nr:hypothetical protein L1987_10256 [Smallanthus sonchifolius]
MIHHRRITSHPPPPPPISTPLPPSHRFVSTILLSSLSRKNQPIDSDLPFSHLLTDQWRLTLSVIPVWVPRES